MTRNAARGFSLVELMVVVAIIGVLASIAMPNFIKLQARAKQSEPKANLRAAWAAQRAYFQEKDDYSSCINKIGFNPERGNRYKYDLGLTLRTLESTCTTADSRASAAGVTAMTDSRVLVDTFKYGLGINANPATTVIYNPVAPGGSNVVVVANLVGVTPAGGGSGSSFGVSASGNIDSDGVNDLWYVSSVSSTTAGICPTLTGGHQRAAAGEPMNSLNDVLCQ